MKLRLDLAAAAAFVLSASGVVGFVFWREGAASEDLARQTLLAQAEGLVTSSLEYQKLVSSPPSESQDAAKVFERFHHQQSKELRQTEARLSEKGESKSSLTQLAARLRRLEEVGSNDIAVCLAAHKGLLKLTKDVDSCSGLSSTLKEGHILSDDLLPHYDVTLFRVFLLVRAESAFAAGKDGEAIDQVRRLEKMAEQMEGSKLTTGWEGGVSFRKEAIGQLCRMAGRRPKNSHFVLELEKALGRFHLPSDFEALSTVLATDLAWVDRLNSYLAQNRHRLSNEEKQQFSHSQGSLQWQINLGKSQAIAAFRLIAAELKSSTPNRQELERLEKAFSLALSKAVRSDLASWSLPWYSLDLELANHLRSAKALGQAALALLKGGPQAEESARQAGGEGLEILREDNQVCLKLKGQSLLFEQAATEADRLP